MVNKLTKKAILNTKKIIEDYGKEMAKLKEKIDAIDEKYRKMAEDARKDLASEYANLEAEQEIWQSSLSRYGDDVLNEVLGEVASVDEDAQEVEQTEENTSTSVEVEETKEEPVVTDTAEEPEQVIDTIFPENNEPEEENENVSAQEKELEELWAEQNVEPEKPADAVPEDAEPMTEEAEEAADQAQKDEWPDFPQEW